MKISKTLFKQYTRCPRVSGLDDIYKRKGETNASIFGEDDSKDNLIELLSTMFDSDTGDDLVNIPNAQMQALLPYYNKLEEYAMQIAAKKFGDNIIYSLDTKKQKSFQFIDDFKNEYYCYLDGFQEEDNVIRVFEVKATTSKKFLELGPKRKGERTPLFIEKDNVLRLNPYDIDGKGMQDHYQKLLNRYSSVGRYAFDLAVERYIVERGMNQFNTYAGKKVEYYLVVLNANYIFDGTYVDGEMEYKPDANGNELVCFIDMSQITADYQEIIEGMKNTLTKYIDVLSADAVNVGKYCERKSMAKCPFVKTCWKAALESGSILEYLGNHHGFKDENDEKYETIDLINSGYLKMDSIPISWLNRPNNRIQRDCYDKNTEYLNKDKIIKGLKAIQYPIFHLDFESFPSPLPRFAGEKPYMQSVFQYSLHIERKVGDCDKDRDHLEFLARDNDDHRLALIEQMIKDIDLTNGGTVLVYNKSFEETRIKEFAIMFPQYKKELEKINAHMFDLIDLVSTRSAFYQDLGFSEEESKINNYYHNELHGSYSIKKVLPLFSDLTYKGMPVANGTEAIAAYASFKYLNDEDLKILQRDLIEYCKQDTWAMVVVLWGLIKKVGIKTA